VETAVLNALVGKVLKPVSTKREVFDYSMSNDRAEAYRSNSKNVIVKPTKKIFTYKNGEVFEEESTENETILDGVNKYSQEWISDSCEDQSSTPMQVHQPISANSDIDGNKTAMMILSSKVFEYVLFVGSYRDKN